MKILIVEDELGIATFLKQGLEEEGYVVVVATNGQEGLDKAITQKPDLILLDWMLPKLSGLDVCLSFRKENTITPIIFLTAKDTVQETIEGLKAGANDYIKKPFSFEELLERIKIHFRKQNEKDVVELKELKFIQSKHQVFLEKHEVILTQREYELLLYLVKNKGTVCTRNQIIEDVWDIHFEYDTGVIDVFMNAIRKKLNSVKEVDYIKTIRGIGYIVNND